MREERLRASRVELARARAARVKVGFGLVAAVVFGGSMLFARLSYAGHAKHKPRALAAPSRFVQVVRESRLQAGVLAPPEAPPAVQTATS